MISTQVGGRQPIDGPIVATGRTAPVNPSEAENEVRQTFSIYLAAVDLRTPDGGHAEDLDVIRSIWAADSLYVFPDGTATTRDERLARGHPNTVQLTGE